MKYIKNIGLLVCLLITLSSCEDWLNVQPKTKIKSDQVFEKPQYFEQALIGIYLNIAQKSLYGQELTFYFMDVVGGAYDLKAASEADSKYYFANKRDYNNDSSRGIISGIWSNTYTAVANINNLLENIDVQSVVPEVTAKMIKGEALGLRAFLHFDLLRMFGPGNLGSDPSKLGKIIIPYVTKYDKNLSPQLDVATTLLRIHSDLDLAIELLDENDPLGTKKVLEESDYAGDLFYAKREFRFNYWAAVATKTRVLMWEGRYDEALVLAEKFINESEIQFVKESDLSGGLDKTFSREYIFGLDVNNLFENSNIKMYLGASGAIMSNKIMYFKANRFNDIFEIETTGISDLRHTYKFSDIEFDKIFIAYQEDEKSGNRVGLIRKPEMYYIAAECLNRLDIRKADAIEYIEQVRRSRTLVDELDPALSKEDLSTEIEKEYYKDLMGEGQIFYYLKRLGVTTLPYTDESTTEESFIFPIPESEIEFGRISNINI